MSPAEKRKAKSEEICRSKDIPVNDFLPLVEDCEAVSLRALDDVAWRAMCLCLVAMKGEGMSGEQVLEIEDEFGLREHLSPKERAFVHTEHPPERDLDNFSWRYEAYWVLLWALGYIDELAYPSEKCDPAIAAGRLWDARSPENFISNAKLRPQGDILDAVDLIYRFDWACVDAKIKGLKPPGDLDPGIVFERHYALNWLVGYLDQEWDDITTDT